jgi:hypothetical protein
MYCRELGEESLRTTRRFIGKNVCRTIFAGLSMVPVSLIPPPSPLLICELRIMKSWNSTMWELEFSVWALWWTRMYRYFMSNIHIFVLPSTYISYIGATIIAAYPVISFASYSSSATFLNIKWNSCWECERSREILKIYARFRDIRFQLSASMFFHFSDIPQLVNKLVQYGKWIKLAYRQRISSFLIR